MREPITEKDNKQEQWYKDAGEQTMETLPDFMDMLASKYTHDYGTICHAMAASAIGALSALNKTEQGGITGFQAGCIMWEFIQKWMHKEGPLRLLEMKEMCYPQYEERFNGISEDTWKSIQESAQEVVDDDAHPDVKAHCESILAGNVPFGYKITEVSQ